MESLRCFCGVEVAGEDENALSLALQKHLDQAHRWQPPDGMLREVLARQAEMVPWDGTLLPVPAGVDIRPLTPGRLENFLQFFDREGFRDNPFWGILLLHGGALRRIRWGVDAGGGGAEPRGEARGYLAYAGNRPIGWCHAAPRTSLAGLMANAEFHVDDPDGVGAIYCFVIAPPYRRQGVAARLLTAAVVGFRAEGLRIAEGYPPTETRSTAEGYHGTLAMFETAGFSPYNETTQHVIVRKALV